MSQLRARCKHEDYKSGELPGGGGGGGISCLSSPPPRVAPLPPIPPKGGGGGGGMAVRSPFWLGTPAWPPLLTKTSPCIDNNYFIITILSIKYLVKSKYQKSLQEFSKNFTGCRHFQVGSLWHKPGMLPHVLDLDLQMHSGMPQGW